MAVPSSGPSPPEWMRICEPSLADGARAHVREMQKKRSSFLPTFGIALKEDKGKGKGKGKGKDEAVLTTPLLEPEPILVGFKDKRKHQEESKSDQFKWAILYENQRGITMFSTAYYSGRSLLPHDPPPFTVPDSGESSPNQGNLAPPNVTLTTYPLPDPTWRWVSKSWLVDMRGDGDVQYDGFEYNWFFRRHGWGAQVGWLSAGGYVRRRRWMRLMMRPSDARLQGDVAYDDTRREDASAGSGSDQTGDTLVWKGDEGDWNRVRKALKSLTRDGPRLELWENWLTGLMGERIYIPPHFQGHSQDRSAGSTPEPHPETMANCTSRSQEHPHREWVLTVLRDHGNELRSYFVYPDSRAQLRDLFVMAGLVQNPVSTDPTLGLGMPSSTTHALHLPSSHLLGLGDFWSRSSGLNLAASTEDMCQHKKVAETL